MSTPCNAFGNKAEAKTANENRKERRERMAQSVRNQMDGAVGERLAAETAIQKLGLIGTFFDQPKHGFDSVYKDKNGTLVFVDAKFTKGKAPASMLKHTNFGRQLSPKWISRKAKLMQNKGTTQYSPDNAKIGREIDQVGAENTRSIVLHTDKETLRVTAYERRPSGNYDKIGSWDTLPEPDLDL